MDSFQAGNLIEWHVHSTVMIVCYTYTPCIWEYLILNLETAFGSDVHSRYRQGHRIRIVKHQTVKFREWPTIFCRIKIFNFRWTDLVHSADRITIYPLGVFGTETETHPRVTLSFLLSLRGLTCKMMPQCELYGVLQLYHFKTSCTAPRISPQHIAQRVGVRDQTSQNIPRFFFPYLSTFGQANQSWNFNLFFYRSVPRVLGWDSRTTYFPALLVPWTWYAAASHNWMSASATVLTICSETI